MKHNGFPFGLIHRHRLGSRSLYEDTPESTGIGAPCMALVYLLLAGLVVALVCGAPSPVIVFLVLCATAFSGSKG